MSVPTNGIYNSWAGNPKGRVRDEKRCWEQVWTGGRGSMHFQCNRPWKVEREGERFCKQHDPVAVEAKRAARDKAWRDRAARQDLRWRRERLQAEVAEAALAWYRSGNATAPHGEFAALVAACEKLHELAETR